MRLWSVFFLACIGGIALFCSAPTDPMQNYANADIIPATLSDSQFLVGDTVPFIIEMKLPHLIDYVVFTLNGRDSTIICKYEPVIKDSLKIYRTYASPDTIQITYRAVLHNRTSKQISDTVIIKGIPARITEDPEPVLYLTENVSCTLSVVATGTEPLRYQWYKGKRMLEGLTESSFIIPAFSKSDTGIYKCMVENDWGSATSLTAALMFIEIKPPVANAGLDTTVGINDTVFLHGSGTTEHDIVLYEWRFGESGDWIVTSSGDTSIVAPSTEQILVCSLRVTDNYRNTDVNAILVTVETRPPTADAGRDTTVGIFDQIHLQGSGTDESEITEYAWKLGESGSWVAVSTGDTVIQAPSTAGAFVCSLRVTDDDGNTAFDAVIVTVETRPPTADAGGDTTVWIFDQIHLQGSGTDESEITEYAWKLGESGSWIVVSTGDTVIQAPSTAGAFVCSLRVTDDDGNTAFDGVIITVETRPPNANAGQDTIVGINDVINLQGVGTGEAEITTYEWKIGTAAWIITSSGDTSIIAPSTAQTLNCSLRVTDVYGKTGVDYIVITIETRPPVANAGVDTSVSVSGTINLRGTGTDETEVVRYEWKIGTGDWMITSSGDTSFSAPNTMQVLVCSLRVTDDDGNTATDEVLINIGIDIDLLSPAFIDDFNDALGDAPNQSALGAVHGFIVYNKPWVGGGSWYLFKDALGSSVKNSLGEEIEYGQEGTIVVDSALHVTLSTSNSNQEHPYAGFGCNLIGEGRNTYVDLSILTAISMKIKGHGTIRIHLITRDIVDAGCNWGWYGYDIDLPEDWANLVIPVSELSPDRYSEPDLQGWTWDHGKTSVIGIEFLCRGGLDAELHLDDIRLEGMTYGDFGFLQ